jgi:NAD(P)-dependent dehydrogenase (short-subunit alcohol dehydrogenase family)
MNITDFSMDFFSLKEKTAIVTGGNTGLGQAFTLALAKAGANVFIPSLVDDGGQTTAMIEESGVASSFMQVDITQDGAPTRIVQKCLEDFGAVDILVNSAGICINRPVAEFGRQDWDRMLSVNLTAAFEMSYEVAKPMTANNRGKIINICSLFSYLGGQWSPAYAASKHGLAGFTKAYSDELAGFNIQVNGIAPGYYATELTTKTRSDPITNQRVLDHIPANRWGETVDLMGATIFLASRASDYVNGHILVVDGGYLVR